MEGDEMVEAQEVLEISSPQEQMSNQQDFSRMDEPTPETSGLQNSKAMEQVKVQTDEEQLFENPIIQNMMKKFIADQFKSMQMEQQKPGKTVTRETVKNVSTIKSPSDTTIYAPALQTRLMPTQTTVEKGFESCYMTSLQEEQRVLQLTVDRSVIMKQ